MAMEEKINALEDDIAQTAKERAAFHGISGSLKPPISGTYRAPAINTVETELQRSTRRALAVNAVETARKHASRDVFTLEDADIICTIQELLEKVAKS